MFVSMVNMCVVHLTLAVHINLLYVTKRHGGKWRPVPSIFPLKEFLRHINILHAFLFSLRQIARAGLSLQTARRIRRICHANFRTSGTNLLIGCVEAFWASPLCAPRPSRRLSWDLSVIPEATNLPFCRYQHGLPALIWSRWHERHIFLQNPRSKYRCNYCP